MKILLLLCYLATWAAVPHLLFLKKRPAATLAWLWAILFIPFLGPLVYCLFGTDRLKRRRLKHRARFSAWPSPQRPPASATDDATAVSIRNLPGRERQFLQLLSRINQLPASSAEELRVLRDAKEFYPALEQRIQNAKRNIHLEFYIWRGDETGGRSTRLVSRSRSEAGSLRA